MSSNEVIRCKILEILKKYSEEEEAGEWGMDRYAILEALSIPEKDLDYNMIYLSRNGLVKTRQSMGVLWYFARITSLGKDVVENCSQYVETFPFIMYQVGATEIPINLIQIKGIGLKTAEKLKKVGITDVHKLAFSSSEFVAEGIGFSNQRALTLIKLAKTLLKNSHNIGN